MRARATANQPLKAKTIFIFRMMSSSELRIWSGKIDMYTAAFISFCILCKLATLFIMKLVK